MNSSLVAHSLLLEASKDIWGQVTFASLAFDVVRKPPTLLRIPQLHTYAPQWANLAVDSNPRVETPDLQGASREELRPSHDRSIKEFLDLAQSRGASSVLVENCQVSSAAIECDGRLYAPFLGGLHFLRIGSLNLDHFRRILLASITGWSGVCLALEDSGDMYDLYLRLAACNPVATLIGCFGGELFAYGALEPWQSGPEPHGSA